jgi:CDP-glycerol glycerophosphotransferase (TagB/SpsB family)
MLHFTNKTSQSYLLKAQDQNLFHNFSKNSSYYDILFVVDEMVTDEN